MRIGGVLPSTIAQPAVQQVAARRTPTSLSDVKAALSRALQSATGQRPSSSTVDVLAAQVSLETARGDQMFNFNFGGIKGAGPSGQTATYTTREVLGGQDVRLQQGFRAYGSLDEGAQDYVSVLHTRFPDALAHAAAGDVVGFAHALKQAHYYTASEQQYTQGLLAVAGGGAALSTASVAPAPGDFSTSAELSRVLDAVAASAAKIADPIPEG